MLIPDVSRVFFICRPSLTPALAYLLSGSYPTLQPGVLVLPLSRLDLYFVNCMLFKCCIVHQNLWQGEARGVQVPPSRLLLGTNFQTPLNASRGPLENFGQLSSFLPFGSSLVLTGCHRYLQGPPPPPPPGLRISQLNSVLYRQEPDRSNHPDWIANIYITWTLAGREEGKVALCGYHWIIFIVFICYLKKKKIHLYLKHVKFGQ